MLRITLLAAAAALLLGPLASAQFTYPNAVDAASATPSNPQTLLAVGDIHCTAEGPWYPVDVVTPLNMPVTATTGAPVTNVSIADDRSAVASGFFTGSPFEPVCELTGDATAYKRMRYLLSGSPTTIVFNSIAPHDLSGTAILGPGPDIPEMTGTVVAVASIWDGISLAAMGPVMHLRTSTPFTTTVTQYLSLPSGSFTISKTLPANGTPAGSTTSLGWLDAAWLVIADNGPGPAAGNGLRDASENTIVANGRLRIDGSGSLVGPAKNSLLPAGDYILEIHEASRSELAVTTMNCESMASGTSKGQDVVSLGFVLSPTPLP